MIEARDAAPRRALPGGLRWRFELARARAIQLGAAAGLRRPATSYVWQRVDEHRACWQAAASSIGAQFVPLADDVWEVRRGDRTTRIANDLVQLDDPVVLAIAGDKELCYRLAAADGVPVPEMVAFAPRERDAALVGFWQPGAPYVVKPASGTSSGIGVTIGVRSRAQLVRAVATAAVRSRRVVVQRMVLGESCRLLFLDGRMIQAVRRRGVRVVPDGRSSVAELLGAAGMGDVVSDPLTAAFLASAGLALTTILPAGPAALVTGLPRGEHGATGLRTIYDEDITALVGQELVEEARRVVAAIGSAWAGVDVITSDPSRPLRERGAFLEINTTPGILHHCPPGRPCSVAATVLERLLEDPAHG